MYLDHSRRHVTKGLVFFYGFVAAQERVEGWWGANSEKLMVHLRRWELDRTPKITEGSMENSPWKSRCCMWISWWMIWIGSFLVLQALPVVDFFSGFQNLSAHLETTALSCFSFSTVLHFIFNRILPRFCLLFPNWNSWVEFRGVLAPCRFSRCLLWQRVSCWPRGVPTVSKGFVLTKGSDTRIWHGIGEIPGTSINQQVPEILEVLFGSLAWKRKWTIQYGVADACSYLLISMKRRVPVPVPTHLKSYLFP